ncbi:MAG: CDP-glycerol glycerophosphotransferase family protein [Planctomycetota bacterium]
MNRAAQRRVLFPASTPLSFGVVEPLMRVLSRDPRIEVLVTVRHGGRTLARQCLRERFTYVSGVSARFRKFDAAVCSGFFFHSRRSRLLVEMFHGVSPKNYAIRGEVRRFDRLFLIGEYHREKFVRAGLLGEHDLRGMRIGMPKTDPLAASGTGDAELIRSLELDPALPTVAYAPTRSGSSGSSLDEFGLDLIDLVSEMPVNLLVKLHDRSLKRYRSKMKVDYVDLIGQRERGRNLRLIRDHDVIPTLAAADLLLTDLSSVGSEFLLRDRPVIYLSVPNHEQRIRSSSAQRFGADDPHDLDYLREAGDLVRHPKELRPVLERALANPLAKSDLRRERAKLLFYNPGAATRHAADALYDLLELETP